MIKALPILGLFILAACALKPKTDQVPQKPVRVTLSDIKQCQDYQKSVLDGSYREVKNGKNVTIEFTRNVNEARGAFFRFDAKKGLIHEKSQLVSNILSKCDEELIKQFDIDYKNIGKCSLMFSELNFFQSLAQGLRTYSWPLDVKLDGKKVALDYVRYFADGDFPLLNRLVAVSVLDELSINQVVNKDIHNDIKVLMQESQSYVQGLKSKLNQNQKLTCESLDVIRDEFGYSKIVGNRMKELLKKI